MIFKALQVHKQMDTHTHTHKRTPKWAPDHFESLDALSQTLQDHKIKLHLQTHTKGTTVNSTCNSSTSICLFLVRNNKSKASQTSEETDRISCQATNGIMMNI